MKRALKATLDYIKKADMLLLALCCISSIFGIMLVWSATLRTGSLSVVMVQVAATLMGIGLFVIFSIIDVDILADKWKLLFLFSTVLFLLLIPFGYGDEVGNKNWLRFLGIGIQPAEVVKVTFTLMMAYHIHYLKEYRDLNTLFSVTQLIVHFGYFFVLIMVITRDLGNALVYLFMFAVMLFIGGLKLRWFALFIALGSSLVPVMWRYLLQDYQKNRILVPYVPSIDPDNNGANFQAFRSKIAIASGGFTGQGLAQGTQTQSGGVPEQQTDFVFSVAGEKLGLVGCTVIILLLTAIIIRCFMIAYRSRNTLSSLVCAGIGAMMLFQTLENIGMCIGLTPVIGITLPLFSSGGSSVIATYVAMGIVCGIKMRTVSLWKRQI